MAKGVYEILSREDQQKVDTIILGQQVTMASMGASGRTEEGARWAATGAASALNDPEYLYQMRQTVIAGLLEPTMGGIPTYPDAIPAIKKNVHNALRDQDIDPRVVDGLQASDIPVQKVIDARSPGTDGPGARPNRSNGGR